MLTPQEHKKHIGAKALLPMYTAEMKKYEELYLQFNREGYTKELCEAYADAFIDAQKKPAVEDIVQIARLYDRIHELKNAQFYLDMLSDKKLTGDERLRYCIECIKNKSKLGHWRDAEDFRTENISFMQKYSEKVDMTQLAEMYISLALADCAAKNYSKAGRLLTAFGYKPQGSNDATLLEMMITAVYISAKSGDVESLRAAIGNAQACLNLFTSFEHPWSKDYLVDRIEDAANGLL
ncbi:MAG: hypothetical protein IJ874_02455 [Ruminococcus sp.]|nr:hypothetical protein [Ruminococcus sp.]